MKRMAVLGMLALASWSAQADQTEPGWRAGVLASFGSFSGDDVPAAELGNNFIDDNTVGFKMYGQYQLNRWLGLEAAYHLSGNFEDRSTSDELPGKLKLNFSGFSAQVVGYVPTTFDDFDFFLKAGYYDFDDELVVNGSTNSNASERGLVGGFGAVFHLSELVGFRVEYERFEADVGDLASVNLGLEFNFGGDKSPAAATSAPPPPPPSESN